MRGSYKSVILQYIREKHRNFIRFMRRYTYREAGHTGKLLMNECGLMQRKTTLNMSVMITPSISRLMSRRSS